MTVEKVLALALNDATQHFFDTGYKVTNLLLEESRVPPPDEYEEAVREFVHARKYLDQVLANQ